MTARALSNPQARSHASAIVGALVAAMRAEGMTFRAINTGLPSRAHEECPSAWVDLRGTLAWDKRLGTQRVMSLLRSFHESQADLAVESAEIQRTAINARLDEQYQRLACTQAYLEGHPATIDAMRKIEADRARLYGLCERQAGGELAGALAELARMAQAPRLDDFRSSQLVVDVEFSKAPVGVEGGTPSGT